MTHCIVHLQLICWASLVAQLVKDPPAVQETWVPSLGWEDPLEKGKAAHSSILAWRIPWPVQFMELQRVRYKFLVDLNSKQKANRKDSQF